MKCLLNIQDNVIHRMPDDDSAELVRKFPHLWKYVPKSEWKKEKRK